MKIFLVMFGALSALILIAVSAFMYSYVGHFGFVEFIHAVGIWIIYEVIIVFPYVGLVYLAVRAMLFVGKKLK